MSESLSFQFLADKPAEKTKLREKIFQSLAFTVMFILPLVAIGTLMSPLDTNPFSRGIVGFLWIVMGGVLVQEIDRLVTTADFMIDDRGLWIYLLTPVYFRAGPWLLSTTSWRTLISWSDLRDAVIEQCKSHYYDLSRNRTLFEELRAQRAPKPVAYAITVRALSPIYWLVGLWNFRLRPMFFIMPEHERWQDLLSIVEYAAAHGARPLHYEHEASAP